MPGDDFSLMSLGTKTGAVALAVTVSEQRDCRHEISPPSHPAPAPRSAFAGFRFPPDVIVLAVRWYLRFGLMPPWMSSG